ncbi:hypothetical protein FOZ63_023039, partial [Perkinsus olseni]
MDRKLEDYHRRDRRRSRTRSRSRSRDRRRRHDRSRSRSRDERRGGLLMGPALPVVMGLCCLLR